MILIGFEGQSDVPCAHVPTLLEVKSAAAPDWQMAVRREIRRMLRPSLIWIPAIDQ
jgi:hypothetical protein